METNNLSIVYEDNHIIVAVKPQNILSQSDVTGDTDMLTMVKDYIKEKYDKPGNVFLGLVHRLDRPTGGLMVFARTSKAASRLSEQFSTNKVRKEYLAVVQGRTKDKQARLENWLKKDESTNMVRLCTRSDKAGKLAVLNYSTLSVADDLTLLKVNIETGRTHQIRVQLSNIKTPLFGDYKYGAKVLVGQKTSNLALWAYKLEFEHPVQKTKMKFTSLPPQDGLPWNLFYLEKEI
jgi:23S rRNA pseudouridine1911/1915/1917 synthase